MSSPEVIEGPPGFADGSAFDAEPVAAAETTDTAAAPDAADDAPAEPAEPAPTTEPVAATPPPAPPVDPARVGMLRDLQAERQARQTAQQEAQRLREELSAARAVAEERERAVLRSSTTADPSGVAPENLQKATVWAHRLGLYNSDGTPDTRAAMAALSDITAEAQSAADAKVRPVLQVLQTAHAQGIKAQVLKVGIENGADGGTLSQLLDQVIASDPNAISDPNTAAAVIAFARGLSPVTPAAPVSAPATTPATTAPVVIPAPNLTERPGRPTVQVKPLTGVERVIASKRGIKQDDWGKSAKFFEENMGANGLSLED